MTRTIKFDFGDQDVVEREDALWVRQKDGSVRDSFFCFQVTAHGAVAITQVNSEMDEVYANHSDIWVPKAIWDIALPWINAKQSQAR